MNQAIAAPVRIRPAWLVGSLGLLAVAMTLSAVVGPADISIGDVLTAAIGRVPVLEDGSAGNRVFEILWAVRFPRVVLGALVGATLALAGAAYQGVFRNPLADPYLLGVAAGAGVGATLTIVSGAGELLPVAAFLGAVAGVVATYGLGRTVRHRTTTTLILAGVAVAAFFTAIQTFIQQRNAETVREVYAWILGRLSTEGWTEVWLVLPYVVVSWIVILLHRRTMDVLALGDDEAEVLGVPVSRARVLVIGAATLGTAAAVAVGGLIGFVGIIVPHTVRLLTDSSYRVVLPLAALLGAAFLVGADLLARTVLSPAELPIGVVTAFLGAPFFVMVLRTSQGAPR